MPAVEAVPVAAPQTVPRERGALLVAAGAAFLALLDTTVAGIGALALGIAQGPDGGWGDAATVGALVVGALAVAAALARSRSHAAPAIETGLWRARPFALANLASLLCGAALFPLMLVGVLVLVQVWGYSGLEAGLAMTPSAVIASVVALRAGPAVAARGARRRSSRARSCSRSPGRSRRSRCPTPRPSSRGSCRSAC